MFMFKNCLKVAEYSTDTGTTGTYVNSLNYIFGNYFTGFKLSLFNELTELKEQNQVQHFYEHPPNNVSKLKNI